MISPTVKRLVLDTSTCPSPFHFLPGQWIDIAVGRDEHIALRQLTESKERQHSADIKEIHIGLRDDPLNRDDEYHVTGFSMTSSPSHSTSHIDLAVKISDHPITQFIHKNVTSGHWLNTIGPDGEFVLPPLQKLLSDHAGRVALIAAGIGVTPLMSMYRYLAEYNTSTARRSIENIGIKYAHVALLYSAKSTDELVFAKEIRGIAQNDPENIHAHLLTTDAAQRIEEGLIQEQIFSRDSSFATDGIFCICGPLAFVNDIVTILQKMGIDSQRILFEKWW